MSEERAERWKGSEAKMSGRELEVGSATSRVSSWAGQGKGTPERQCHEGCLALRQEGAGEGDDRRLQRRAEGGRRNDGPDWRRLRLRPRDGHTRSRATSAQGRRGTSAAGRAGRREAGIARVRLRLYAFRPSGGKVPRPFTRALVVVVLWWRLVIVVAVRTFAVASYVRRSG